MSDSDNHRNLPTSELDLNMMVIDSVWGRQEVSQDLKNRLSRIYRVAGVDGGEDVITKESLWGLLGVFTRDMRLANLSSWDNELQTCRYYIDLANDLLNSDMVESCIVAMSRVANILETSQSKGGFFRKMMNTFRQHSIMENREPPKRGFFGGKKQNEGGNY